ncbi:MAG: class I SAM-dependent methyltransferase [Myxococcota bacterium]
MAADEDATAALAQAVERLRSGAFAFVDAGCSSGGSLDYCARTFGQGRGVGFDRSPAKVASARAAGHEAYEADLGKIELPAKSVLFVSLLDFLEHLPDLETTRVILERLARVARDFLFIRHPSFEDIAYLRSLGLKLDWTDWHGHRNMMRLRDFESLCREFGWPAPTILAQKPILDSDHPSILPLSAPPDSVGYDASKHGPKPKLRFERPVYTQFDIFIGINPALTPAQWFRITERVVSPQAGTRRI